MGHGISKWQVPRLQTQRGMQKGPKRQGKPTTTDLEPESLQKKELYNPKPRENQKTSKNYLDSLGRGPNQESLRFFVLSCWVFQGFCMFHFFEVFWQLCRVWFIVEGSLEVKLPTIWTDEKQSRAEAERRERLEERRVEEKVRRKKMQR